MPEAKLGGIAGKFVFSDAAAVRGAPQLLSAGVYLTGPAGWTPGGTLTVSGVTGYDRLSILGNGTGPGQVSVAGDRVSYGGVEIGTVSGGAGTTLSVAFNANATADAVAAVTARVAYQLGGGGVAEDHSLQLGLIDGAGASIGFASQWEPRSDITSPANPFAGFTTAPNYGTAIGDLNGDGHLDIIVTMPQVKNGQWYVYSEVENEDWFAEIASPEYSLAPDGVTMLVRDSAARSPLSTVYLNDGQGGFVASGIPLNSAIDMASVSVTLADGDRDGDLDLFYVSTTALAPFFQRIYWLANDGTGHFNGGPSALNETLSVDHLFAAVAVGDIDGDGALEGILSISLGGILWDADHPWITRPPSDGPRYWDNPHVFEHGGFAELARQPALIDYDRDGDLDLVTWNPYSNAFDYFENVGGSSFQERTGAANPFAFLNGNGGTPQFADIDMDGDLDLIVASGGGLQVHWNNSLNGGTPSSNDGQIRLDFNFPEAPEGIDKTLAGTEDTPLTLGTAAFGYVDANLDGLSGVVISSLPTGGVLTLGGAAVASGQLVSAADLRAGNLVFTPNADAYGAGAGRFTFQVKDDSGLAGNDMDLSPNTITVNLAAVPDTPVVTAAYTEEDFQSSAGLVITRNAADGAEVTHFKITGIQNGKLYLANGTTEVANGTFLTVGQASAGLKFTPNPDFNGTATFGAQASTSESDAGLGGGVATGTIVVASVNDAPIAVDDAFTFAENSGTSALDVLGNDRIAPDVGEQLTVTSVSQPAEGGIVSLENGEVRFTPFANFNGTTSFAYSLSDGNGGSSSATVSLTVTSVSEKPTGTDKVISVASGDSYVLSIHDFGFRDSDGDSFVGIVAGLTPSPGQVTLFGSPVSSGQTITYSDIVNGNLRFTAPSAQVGFETFQFTVKDSGPNNDVAAAPNVIVFEQTQFMRIGLGISVSDGIGDFTGYKLTLSNLHSYDRSTVLGGAAQIDVSGTTVSYGGIAIGTLAGGVGEALTVTFNGNATQEAIEALAPHFAIRVIGNVNYPSGHDLQLALVAPDDSLANTPVQVPTNTLNGNFAPTALDGAANVVVGQQHVFKVEDFRFTDDNGHKLVAVTFVEAPAGLTIDGSAVAAGQTISMADVAAGKLAYTATAAGPATVRFTVRDEGGTAYGGSDTSAEAQFALEARGGTPPDGSDGTVVTREGGAHIFAASDFGFTDADGDAFAGIVVTSLPTEGALTLNGASVSIGQTIGAADLAAGKLAFAPTGTEHGSSYASFGFTVLDSAGSVDPSPNVLTIDVRPVAGTPSVSDASTNEDAQSTSGLVVGRNAADGVEVTHFRITNILNGTLYLADGVTRVVGGTFLTFAEVSAGLKFTPIADFNGVGSFRVQASTSASEAGLGGSAVAATITVAPVNDAPIANTDTVTVAEDSGAVVIDVRANDSAGPDVGEALSVVAVAQPTQGGTVALIGDVVRFVPTPNFNGSTSFTYTLSDGNGGVATGTVNVTVTPVNDNPTPSDDSFTVAEDSGATALDILANDSTAPDAGETLTITAITQPANGTVSLQGGQVNFTPAANFNGTTSFTYTVSDGNGGSATATASVTVTPVNDAPTANDDTRNIVVEDGLPRIIDVLANDSFAPDLGETLSVVAVTQPANGTVTLIGGQVRFAPAPDFNGDTSFTYTISDGNGGTATATVNVTVLPVNDAPTAVTDDVTVLENASATVIDVLANDGFAPDIGETLSVAAVTQPASGGTVTLASGIVSFTPTTGFNGNSSFTYTLSDGNGGTATGTVNVRVSPVIDTPRVTDATTDEDVQSSSGLIVGRNAADGDEVTHFKVSGITSGRVYLADGTTEVADGGFITVAQGAAGLKFTGNADFNGVGSFLVQSATSASDAGASGGTAVATITIAPINDAPTLANDSFSVAEDSAAATLDVLANDSFAPDMGETLSVTAVTQPTSGGTVTLTGGIVQFTPSADFHGTTSFGYTVSDGNGGTATATATVTVTPVNDAPSGADRAVTVTSGDTRTFTAADFGFTDSDGGSLSGVVIATLPTLGTLRLNGTSVTIGQEIAAADLPNLRYQSGVTGAASFTFQLRDNGGTAGGGVDLDPTPNTLAITVQAPPEPPVLPPVTPPPVTPPPAPSLTIGGNGADTLTGTAGMPDTLSGGLGSDTYVVDESDTIIEIDDDGSIDIVEARGSFNVGNAHIEVIRTVDPNSTAPVNLTGNFVSQEITGNNGSNVILGGTGADTLAGLGGDDVYVIGDERAIVIEQPDAVPVIARQGLGIMALSRAAITTAAADVPTVAQGYDTVFTSVSYALRLGSSIEVLSTQTHASTAAINLTGNEFAQTIIGNYGDNMLVGGGGADTLIGLHGNDVYVISDAGTVIFDDQDGGSDTVFSQVSYALTGGAQIETLSTQLHAGTTAINFTGNGFAQTIIGNYGDNILVGGGGADTLIGLHGNDIYVVGDAATVIREDWAGGTDTVYAQVSYTLSDDAQVETLSTQTHAGTTAIDLTGNAFAQTIIGNYGDNILAGGGGADTLIGLDGNDTFVLDATPGTGVVTIADFTTGEDRIALAGASFGLSAGALSSEQFVAGTSAADANDRILYDAETGQLWFDADGNGAGAAMLIGQLTPGAVLLATDLMVPV